MYEHKQGHCPCLNANRGFSKVLDLPGPGLAIYHHSPNAKTTSNDISPKVQQTFPIEKQYSIVLENTKNVKIKAKDIERALGSQKITCPRCRFIYKRALNLIHDIYAINENDIIGVCNHCRMIKKFGVLCDECESTVAKFKLSKPSKHLLEEIEYKKSLFKPASTGFKSGNSDPIEVRSSGSEESLDQDTRDNVVKDIDGTMTPKFSETEITTLKGFRKEKQFSFYFPKTKSCKGLAKEISSTLLLKQATEKVKQSKTRIEKEELVSIQDFKKKADSTTKTTTSPAKDVQIKKKDQMDIDNNLKRTEEIERQNKHPKKIVDEEKRPKEVVDEKKRAKENEDEKKRAKEIEDEKKRAKEIEEEKKRAKGIEDEKKRAKEIEEEKKRAKGIEDEKKRAKEIEEEKKRAKEIEDEKKRAKETEEEKKRAKEIEDEKKRAKETEEEKKRAKGIEDEKKKQGLSAKKGDETVKEKATLTPAPAPSIKVEENTKINKAALDDFEKLKEQRRKEKEAEEKNKLLQDMEQEKLRKAQLDKANAAIAMQEALLLELSVAIPETKEMLKERALLVDPVTIKKHKYHQKVVDCVICDDSLLDLEIQSIEFHKKFVVDKNKIIGEKLFKYSSPIKDQISEYLTPAMDESLKGQHGSQKSFAPLTSQEQKPTLKKQRKDSVILKKNVDNAELTKGVIRYSLSDRSFIDKGWTMLPTEKIVRKMNVYRMRPAHPEFDWFEYNKKKKQLSYDTGSTLAEFKENGRGQLFYRNGQLALDYYDTKDEANGQHRFVVYSSGEPDARGRSHPVTVLATFDYLGNGVVLDHAGKIRLKYNQTEGVVLDRSLGPVSHWKWHTLNDPPVLRQVMIDTHMAMKDPVIMKLGRPGDEKNRVDNEDMLAIEFENSLKEQSKKLNQKFKPFQIKMKAMKINEHFSLRVLDQATIYLIFRDGSTNIKLNLGMILDNTEIVDTDTAELGEVSNILEKFPARTESVTAMQRSVAYAQRYERARSEHERRLCRPQPVASADQLLAARARPLHVPPATLPTNSFNTNCYCRCIPLTLYYNSRII